jgi:hypothetical protein
MSIRRKRLFWFGSGLLFVGLAFLVFPPYSAYCETDYANNYFCAAYTVTVALATWVDVHSGAVTAIATAVIGCFTITIWKINDDQLKHGRRVERAYVNMSHKPPGIMFGTGPSISIEIDIKNHGRTPARVTDALLSSMIVAEGRRLPDQPIYTNAAERQIPSAFLVADDFFIFAAFTAITEEQFAQVRNGASRLCIVGYVDYIDQFGQRHRGGYGRVYDREGTGNNLAFINERGYNYDRVRLPGDGNDWNENG